MTPTEIVLLVAEVLDALGVPYVVVGSLASSARGVPRSSSDADVVAQLEHGHIASLVNRLSDSFYVDSAAVERAVVQGRRFNAVHLDSGFTIDVFVPPPGGFGRQQLARGVQEDAGSGAKRRKLRIATAEDILLAKLLYLRAWAAKLELADLLERVLTEESR